MSATGAEYEIPDLHLPSPDYPSLLADGVLDQPSALDTVIAQSRGKEFPFSGGLPQEATFPDMVELLEQAEAQWGKVIYQYGASAGLPQLREAAVPFFKWLGAVVEDPAQVVVTGGSQSALSVLGREFFNPGDYVAIEGHTYLGAIEAFHEYQPRLAAIQSDTDGMIPESLEEVLSGSNGKIKSVYVVPNFQNPTGVTMPWQRRIDIVTIAANHGVPIIEDDPYGQLRYEGHHIPPMQAIHPDGVIYTTTLSKMLAPGLRIGLTRVPKHVGESMIKILGGRTLCGSMTDQAIAATYISSGRLELHVPRIIETYRPLRDAMVGAIREHFPDGWTFAEPQGGMFVFPRGPTGTDTDMIYQKALDQGVAFVPGRLFSPNGLHDGMRLCFSYSTVDKINGGMERIGNIIRESSAN